MSSVKEYWFDVMQQDKDEWIKQHLDEEDADESTEGWDELSREYDLLQERSREQAEFDAELNWYEEFSYSDMHDSFLHEMNDLVGILNNKIDIFHEEATYKMIYAHSVTLLESFLGDTLKSLVRSKTDLFNNAVSKVDELTKARFNLKDIAVQKDGAIGLAIKELSEILYHNIPKVKRVYESVLDVRLDIDISEIDKITSVRHDIVHRNGKTKEGTQVIIDKERVENAIREIKKFVEALQIKINEKINA